MKLQPKAVNDFIKLDTSTSNAPKYCSYLDIDKNEPVLRTFAYQKTKSKGTQIQEIMREYLDHNEVNDCFYFTQMGGYRVFWKGSKKLNSYWYYSTPLYVFEKTMNCWRPNIYITKIQTIYELNAIMSKYIKYFYIPNLTNVESIMEFARVYKVNPRIELLSKAGFPYLFNDKMMMKVSKDKMKDIAKWIKNNKGFMYSNLPNYKFIVHCIKNRLTGEERQHQINISKNLKYMAENGYNYTYAEMEEIEKYLTKQKEDITIYADYLKLSKKLNRDLSDHSILFPRELSNQHACLLTLIDAKRNEELNSRLIEKYNKYTNYALCSGNLKIVVAKEVSDFVCWGKKLHCCVGSLGYDEKMADGKCLIIGLFANNEIVECCELNPKNEIVQLRGDHNQPSEYHDECLFLVNSFIEKLNISYL